ncbi:hypothetical protein FG91_03011 [Sphingopyxis sp. LC81]|uniref:hypothetical protein n=1 Tax=Sphingopyxis sp. LC81 TaxID=1502850 RepID=UPI00050EEC8B|nr:hypothetical protein [Sphingopyxis sp. LC81]KGB53080.1 hypothetical protein FG91_03011 [Sphingopyxis sp. LC81]
MEATLKYLTRILPLVFGIGFLAPLFAQAMAVAGLLDPEQRLAVGLAVGGGWGLLASITGRWI